MSYAVVWNPQPAEQVDAVWSVASADFQTRIEEALGSIQSLLADKPLATGESREDRNTRVHTQPPITIHFRIIERLNLVRIYAARVYSQD